uniref:Uncharacterized protein n=1 Tax=Thermofilum pendens TaxID=2269 RepID=A0A7C3WT01_THEPE
MRGHASPGWVLRGPRLRGGKLGALRDPELHLCICVVCDLTLRKFEEEKASASRVLLIDSV